MLLSFKNHEDTTITDHMRHYYKIMSFLQLHFSHGANQ